MRRKQWGGFPPDAQHTNSGAPAPVLTRKRPLELILPHEFAAFGVSLDESRRRFTEGLAQITMLLKDENVTSMGGAGSRGGRNR